MKQYMDNEKRSSVNVYTFKAPSRQKRKASPISVTSVRLSKCISADPPQPLFLAI